MTVAELKENLKNCDDNDEVLVYTLEPDDFFVWEIKNFAKEDFDKKTLRIICEEKFYPE